MTAEFPRTEDVRALLGGTPGIRATLLLPLPRRPGFDELAALPARARRLHAAAGRRLRALPLDEAKVSQLLDRWDPAEVEDLAPLGGACGLAVLLDGSAARRFLLHRAPRARAFVGRSFRVLPLLDSARAAAPFRLVALATGEVALYEGDAHGLRRVEGDLVPGSLVEALGAERTESQLRFHRGASPDDAPIFHGHGGASRGRNVDRERFHRVLARALGDVWGGDSTPVVLAADRAHAGRFRKIVGSSVPLVRRGLGNPGGRTPEELHERALAIVRGHAERSDLAVVDDLLHAEARGAATSDVERAGRAAAAGRVARLGVHAGASLPGHLDPAGRLTEACGDEDALDELSGLALRNGAEVHVLPGKPPPGRAAFVAGLRS